MPGGGVALVNAVEALDAVEKGLEGDVQTGVKILRRALEEPMRTLAENAGQDGAVIIENVRREQKAQEEQEHRLRRHDRASTSTWSRPASSTRPRSPAARLENAASIAAMILTTEALITDIPEKEKAGPGGGGAPDMGGMY